VHRTLLERIRQRSLQLSQKRLFAKKGNPN